MIDGSWWRPREDSALIASAANLAEVSEHDILALAYYWWFASPAPHSVMKQTISVYLTDCKAPSWARQYARELLDADLNDPHERERLALNYIPRREAPPRYIGWTVVIVTFLVFALFFWALFSQHPDLRIEAADSATPQKETQAKEAHACDGGSGADAVVRFIAGFSGSAPGRCP